MNRLFQKLVNVLTGQYGPNSKIVPFSIGRIYQCTYRNWHHDPRPLLFIVGSNVFYTIGINIHYLYGAWKYSLSDYIIMMRRTTMVITGLAIYKTLKANYPTMVKKAFRKYFTSMLRGKLVSEGISQAPEFSLSKFFAEPFIKQLNQRIVGLNKKRHKATPESNIYRSQIIQTQYYKNREKPFAGRTQRNIVQYRPPTEAPPEGETKPPEGEQ